MQRNRKETAWKKNRKLGDIQGGRMRTKLADNIFNRKHSFRRPLDSDELPIYLAENPSSDFYFPLGEDGIEQVLARLPKEDVDTITHVWLRRCKRTDYQLGRVPFAEFTCGSGCRIITLYPWPKDRILHFGKRRLPARLLRHYSPWTEDLRSYDGTWALHWTEESLRSYYEYVLTDAIGTHLDWLRRTPTGANRRKSDESASQYAIRWSKRKPEQAPPAQ